MFEPGGGASTIDLTGLGGNLEVSQPLPIGAAHLTTDFTNAAKAEVGVYGAYGKPNEIFYAINLAYSWHKATNSGNNVFAAPAIKLTFYNNVCDDTASLGDCYVTLIYEPYWNGSNGPGVVSPLTLDTWTTESINDATGVFWTSGGFGLANGAGGPPFYTLAEALAAASSDFANADLIMISVAVGSYNQGQIDYFDNVQISGTNTDASYDFEAPVQITCEGFQAPMDKIVSVKKKNRVLPLKMVCFDADGNELTDADLSAPPVLEVDYSGPGPAIPLGEEYLPAGQGDEGNQFSYSGNAWQFNLQSKNFSGSGAYNITAVAGDGSYVINPVPTAVFIIQ